MSETEASPAVVAFSAAIVAQRKLEAALFAAGIDPGADLPQMVADVDALGEPRIVLGPITTATAERLANALQNAGTAKRKAGTARRR